MDRQEGWQAGQDGWYEASPVAMAVADDELVLRSANAALAALLGEPHDSLAGRSLRDWAAAEELPALERLLSDARGAGGTGRARLHLQAGGRCVHVDVVVRQLGGAEQGGWLLWLHDLPPAERPGDGADPTAGIIEQVPAVLWRTDAELRVSSMTGGAVQRAVGHLLGLSVSELAGDEDEAGPMVQAHHRALAGESVRYEFPWRGRVYDSCVEPFREEGRITGVVGIGLDVTERKQAEQALAVQSAHLERLFDQAPEGIALLDPEWRVIRANPEFTRIFGYTQAEAAGRLTGELLVPAERAEEHRRIVERVAAGETVLAEVDLQRRDGTPVETSVLVTPVCIGPECVAVYTIYRDITGNRRAAEELAGAVAHYRRLVETSPYGIFATDGQARLVEVNEALAEILGDRVPALLGRSFTDVLAPESREEPLRAFEQRMRGQETGPYEGELVVLRTDGEPRRVEVRSSPIVDGGQVAGVHGVVRDVTEERARAAHLRRVERLAAVGTLIGGVAHELNNPLSAIRGFAQLLLLEPRSADDREALEVMQREADRAAKVVADLRRLARDTQEGGLGREGVDLNEVARHVLRLRAYSISTHNVEVELRLDPQLPPVRADRAGMEQVLLNLVVNAAHAMRDVEGLRRLTIQTRRHGRVVQLQVGDTGHGIAPEHLERIFDAFWTTKPPGEGTGLGLSLVHSIVAEHGGTVNVENAPGGGALFTVELPPADEAAAAAPVPAATPAGARRLLRALVVDDEPAVRRTIARTLELRGHQVTEAGDGGEALRLLARGVPFDVVVADLRMPGLGGDRLLEELRAQATGVDRRVVFVTGDAVSPDATRFLSRARVPVLEKPFDLACLVEVVERRAEEEAEPSPPGG